MNNNEILDFKSTIHNQLHNIEILPKGCVDDLVFKAKNGDHDATQKLCTSYLRYIYSLVKKYERPNYPIQDLLNDGAVGLLKSVKSFNPDKGCFTTHVKPWILKYATESLRKKSKH